MGLFKKIEAGANIAVIVLVALFAWTVFRGSFGNPSATSAIAQPTGPKVGLNMNQTSLKDVNWTENKTTLVLGLQTTCHYCTESAPFFQKLALAAAGRTKIVAVLPQSIDQSKEYLSKLAVHVDEVRSAPLTSINVSGTPTVLLIDGKGVVKNVWVGKLPEAQQTEVLNAIAPGAATPARAGAL